MERESLSVDVLFVGAGPANLAAAFRLASILRQHERLASTSIAVIEKAREVGAHILSGAVMDPRGMEALFGPGWREAGCPVESPVTREAVYLLGESVRFRFPFIPPNLRNHGGWIVTLSHVVQWMKSRVESLGVDIFEGLPGAELLMDGTRVAGVRTVDQGVSRTGERLPAFQPGTDILARVTVLGEGSRGSLTKSLIERLNLAGPNPDVYGTGVKELWEIPEGRIGKGTVIHTAGWPLGPGQYGGSWIYALTGTRISAGFVAGLDTGDPAFDPWETMQTWKTHPFVRRLLHGGKLLKAGAKTVPEGGYFSMPQPSGDGFLIIGDSANLLDISRLKGIHTAIQSGILAAETLAEALERDDASAQALSAYDRRLRESFIHRELRLARNWRQAFVGKPLLPGMIHAGLLRLFGGRLLRDRLPMHSDASALARAEPHHTEPMKFDGSLTIDKLTGVYHAGSVHEENQPSHLVVRDTNICATRCGDEFGHPCERFCPAHVYEIVTDGPEGVPRLRINASNCVHCKTCDIMDPYGVITWTVPSDAGGPNYVGL